MKEYYGKNGKKISRFIWFNGRKVPIYEKEINMDIEIDDDEFNNEDDDVVEDKKDVRKPKYTMEFGKDGFTIKHTHYEDDSAEYEIYEDGQYVDTAESMEELRYLINEWKKKKGKGDNNGKGKHQKMDNNQW